MHPPRTRRGAKYHRHDYHPREVQFPNDGMRQGSLPAPRATCNANDADVCPWWTVVGSLCYGVMAASVFGDDWWCRNTRIHPDCSVYRTKGKPVQQPVSTSKICTRLRLRSRDQLLAPIRSLTSMVLAVLVSAPVGFRRVELFHRNMDLER